MDRGRAGVRAGGLETLVGDGVRPEVGVPTPDLLDEPLGVLELTSLPGQVQRPAECVAARLVVGASRPPDQVRQQHGAGR